MGHHFDAADQAGLSDVWRSHPADVSPAAARARCGQVRAGPATLRCSITSNSVTLAIRSLNPGRIALPSRPWIHCASIATDLLPFFDEPGGFVQATDTLAIKVEVRPCGGISSFAPRALTRRPSLISEFQNFSQDKMSWEKFDLLSKSEKKNDLKVVLASFRDKSWFVPGSH
jgi:hypothetical protein